MSRKDKTFKEFWQLLCTLVKKTESLGVEVDTEVPVGKILEAALNPKTFLKLNKAAWTSAGTTSQLALEGAREVTAFDRANLTYSWAKRFGKKLEMRAGLSELQSPLLTTACDALQKIDDGLKK